MAEPWVEVDSSTRQRILAATAEVLGRNGMTKLSLSEVAAAGRGVAADALSVVRLQEGTARRIRGVGAAVLRACGRRGDRRPSRVREARCGAAGDRRLPAVLSGATHDRHRTGAGHQAAVAGHSADARSGSSGWRTGPIPPWRCRRLCAWRFRTTWCAATMTTTSWISCGTPPGSSTTRLEFGEDLVGVLRPSSRCGRARFPRRAVEVRGRGHHRARRHPPSGTYTTPPAAWNCSSAMTSSSELIGDQKKSGSPAKISAHSSSGLVAKISSSSAISSPALTARLQRRVEARIGQPVGPADGAAQRRPVPTRLQADDPEPSPVAGRVVVHARIAHRLALADRDGIARSSGRC